MARNRPWRGRAAYAVGAVLLVLSLVAGCFFDQDRPDGGSNEGSAADQGRNDSSHGADGDATSPPPLRGQVQWKTDPPSASGLTTLSGWVNDRVVATAAEEGLAAVNRRTGKLVWSLDPPRPRTWPKKGKGRQFCGASTDAVRGQVAVTYGQKDSEGIFRCVGLRVVDLNTGHTVWDQPLVRPHDDTTVRLTDATGHVEMAGDAVLVAEYDRFHALSREDGDELWADLPGERKDGCAPSDLAAADSGFVTLENCLRGRTAWRVRRIDAEDGSAQQDEQIRRGQFKAGMGAGAGLVATDPLTVLLQGQIDSPIPQRIVSWPTKDGEPTVIESKVGGKNAFDGQPMNATSGHLRYRMLVADGLIVAPTGDWMSQRNELVAFDTRNGKRAWSVDSGSAGALVPVAIDDGSVIAVSANSRERSMAADVVRVDLDTGRRQPVISGYQEYGVRIGIRRGLLRWHDGRIYGVPFSPVPPTPIAFALG